MIVQHRRVFQGVILGFATLLFGSSSFVRAEEVADTPPVANGLPDYDRAIEFFQKRIQQQPRVPANYVMLAQRYSRKAKETGAEECYGLAEEALKKALELAPKDINARLMMSGVLAFRHQFAASLKLAQEVSGELPGDLDVLTSVHDAQMGLGDYDAAGKSLDALAKQAQGPVPGLWVRQAQFAEIHGRDEEAIKLLKQANAVVLESSGDYRAPNVAWYQVRLGHQLLDSGKIDEAAAQFEEAMNGVPKYFLGVAGLAEARAAQGRFDDALKLYTRTIELAPDPIFYMAAGDIHTHLGATEKAREAYAVAEKTILESEATPAEYSRELSLFYSERDLQSKKAVELAQTDLKFRQDIMGHDALAWALYRDGQFEEAATAMQQALRTGCKNAKLHYHAGMIQQRLGHAEAAKKHLSHALAQNAKFSVLDAEVARRTLQQLSPSSP